MNYDIVIIGGGPAGLSAGINVAKAGCSVLLIEKNIYPREKICAGILTQKTVSFLSDILNFSIHEHFPSSKQVTVMYKGKPFYNITVQNPFTFVPRDKFDYLLLKTFQESDGQVIENASIVDFFPQANSLLLASGDIITYNNLVVADGVHSPIRKKLSILDPVMALCLQDSIKYNIVNNSNFHPSELQLNFGDLKNGYSWIVSNQGNIIVGSGMFIDHIDYTLLVKSQDKMLEHLGIVITNKRKGAFVPAGKPVNQMEHPYENIVLAGDAAGLTNPLTGEGIYNALLSGAFAGQAHINNPANFRTYYLKLIQSLETQISEQYSLQPQLYDEHLLSVLFSQFKDYPEYIASICDNVISTEKQSYSSLMLDLQQLLR